MSFKERTPLVFYPSVNTKTQLGEPNGSVNFSNRLDGFLLDYQRLMRTGKYPEIPMLKDEPMASAPPRSKDPLQKPRKLSINYYASKESMAIIGPLPEGQGPSPRLNHILHHYRLILDEINQKRGSDGFDDIEDEIDEGPDPFNR